MPRILESTSTYLPLRMRKGNPHKLTFTFMTDMTGWSAWACRTSDGTTTWTATIDSSEVLNTGVVTAVFALDDVTAMPKEGTAWEFEAFTPEGRLRTFYDGPVLFDRDRIA